MVDRLWRAEALAEMIAEAGLQPEISRTDEDTPLVRTAMDARLVRDRRRVDARRGQDGSGALAARPAGTAGLDAGRGHSRGRPVLCSGSTRTHRTPIRALASALMRVGIAPTLIGTRGGASGVADQWPQDGCHAW